LQLSNEIKHECDDRIDGYQLNAFVPIGLTVAADERAAQNRHEEGANLGPATMSSKPALSATSAIINSGALPKVALSNPPIASPVRVDNCSVDATISAAMGTIAKRG